LHRLANGYYAVVPDDQVDRSWLPELAVAEQFGGARGQVRRDHLISHLLAAIGTNAADQVIFFGGTALSRTIAPDGRLSEDIDLIALGRRRDTAEQLEPSLLRDSTRIPRPALAATPTAVRDTEPGSLSTTDGIVNWRRNLFGQTLSDHHRPTRGHHRRRRRGGHPIGPRMAVVPIR
jgi:hypothetical protein